MGDARPSRITINGAPRLRRIISLDIFNTVLEIQGIVIQAGMVEQPPQIRSVRHLGLQVNYTVMVGMLPRQIEQILRSFPRVKSLDIWVMPMNSQSYPINCLHNPEFSVN
uniref:F-box/LRR-repeat protein 15/At3g58940/PEG3-like LRR domain-containing protein n=1 Tax=Oryza meridionalis TaxID=40149 RepID=A0A0E0FDU8_9ORYZ